MRDEVELLVEKAETIQHYGFDRMAGSHHAHVWVLLRRLVDDRGDAEFFKHACDKAKGI